MIDPNLTTTAENFGRVFSAPVVVTSLGIGAARCTATLPGGLKIEGVFAKDDDGWDLVRVSQPSVFAVANAMSEAERRDKERIVSRLGKEVA